MSNKSKKTWKNSTWIDDLNDEHKKEVSKVVDKIQFVPLGPKRVKLSEIHDNKSNWQYVQPKVNNQREETLVNDQKKIHKRRMEKNKIEIRNRNTLRCCYK